MISDLINKIEQWAEDRNIIKGSKPIDQAMKLFSELGELADNVGKGRDCRDDIGDIFVVLTIIGEQVKSGTMKLACQDSYVQDVEWANEEQPRSLNSIKELVLMLNRDFNLLSMNIDTYNCTDEINSCVRTLDRIAELSNTTLEECVQIAYNDIKDRKGLMHQGIFIKESDPAYAEVLKSIEQNYGA